MNFFKDLNTDKHVNGDIFVIESNEDNNLNDTLNSRITKDEIVKAFRSAKNNKSSGDDKIIEEYISSSF